MDSCQGFLPPCLFYRYYPSPFHKRNQYITKGVCKTTYCCASLQQNRQTACGCAQRGHIKPRAVVVLGCKQGKLTIKRLYVTSCLCWDITSDFIGWMRKKMEGSADKSFQLCFLANSPTKTVKSLVVGRARPGDNVTAKAWGWGESQITALRKLSILAKSI